MPSLMIDATDTNSWSPYEEKLEQITLFYLFRFITAISSKQIVKPVKKHSIIGSKQ